MIKISRETKVGLFAFAGITILILGYNFLKGYDILSVNSTYYVVYTDVSGVVKSTQVTINGFRVGQVENISMLREGDASRILVKMMIKSSIQVPLGTKATITGDLLGNKTIAVTLAQNKVILHDGDTLTAGVEESLTSTLTNMVSPLKEKSEQVLVTLDRVLTSMNDIFDSSGTQKLARGINDFASSLEHLKHVSDRLDELSSDEAVRLRNIFAHVESIMLNLRSNNETVTRALKNISLITDSIAAANLTATINNTNRAMTSFTVMLEKINRGEGSLGKLANDKALYDNLSKSSAELTLLMKDMQEYPGRYFSVSVFGGGNRAEKQDKKREDEKKKK